MKGLRNRLDMTMRQVEEYSRRIAEIEGKDEFFISNARLTQIENKKSTPSIYKLWTLSIIYRVKFADLLKLYGLDLKRLKRKLPTVIKGSRAKRSFSGE